MADFWRGVAQGFGPAYQASLSRREKMDAILAQQKREDDLLADKLKRDKARQDILDERYKTERAEGRAALALAAKVDARKQEEAQETLRATFGATSPEVQQEALMSVGGVPIQGSAPGDDARTFTPTPEQFKGLDRGALSAASARSEAQQTLANELAKEERKAEEDKAAATTLLQNEILEMEGQLGIEPTTKPSDGLQMRSGPQLRQYYGELKRKVGEMVALRPKYQAPKPEDKGTQPERAAAEMKVLREEYNASGTTPERQGVLASEALGLLPLLYGQATQTHTIEDAEGYLQGKGLPKAGGKGRTDEPASPEALSKEETDHLNAARTMQRAKNLYMAKFGEKDAKKQLTLEGQLSHWIRNVAGAAAGLESWKDEEAAEFRAAADNLTAKALAQTHQMMGGGAFSEPDRILYERTIPTTKTFSPVNYMAKLKTWSEGLDDYVDYMTARQKIAGLPRLVSDMEPWQVMKFTDKKDDDGNVIISKGMAEMLIEHKLALNPETNKTWTTQGLLDYQRENEQHGFTKPDMINFILMLPYEVKPPR
jgi:hypothetical protein